MLVKKFSDAPGILDYLLEVEIADDRSGSALRVHRGCVLNQFSKKYSIDLVSIPLRVSKVIIEMDWLGTNGAMIDYGCQLGKFEPQVGENWLFLERELRMCRLSIQL